MAGNDMFVEISGTALSMLFYENVRSPGDQMGFLLGESLEFVSKSYTDSDHQVETVKTYNNIETSVTCPLPYLLHDSVGRINKEKLRDFLRDTSKLVIGWFHFRRDTNLVPTMRDKMLHKEFASYFCIDNGLKEECFLICLSSFSTSDMRGTHKFKHVFLRRKRGTFEPISSKITNLGDDSCKHDGLDYKPTPTKKMSDSPDIFAKMLKSINLDSTRFNGLEAVTKIQKTTETYLNHLIPKVCESDLEVAELEREVDELRSIILYSRLKKSLKVNGDSDIMNQNCDFGKDALVAEAERGSIRTCPPSTEYINRDNICSDQNMKDASTSGNQSFSLIETDFSTAYILKKSDNNKSNTVGIDMDMQKNSNQESTVNINPDKKIEIPESIPHRNKGEGNASSLRRGKANRQVNSGTRKDRQSSSSFDIGNSSERNSYSNVSEQEYPETKSLHSTVTRPLSYTDVAKRNLGSMQHASDSRNNH